MGIWASPWLLALRRIGLWPGGWRRKQPHDSVPPSTGTGLPAWVSSRGRQCAPVGRTGTKLSIINPGQAPRSGTAFQCGVSASNIRTSLNK